MQNTAIFFLFFFISSVKNLKKESNEKLWHYDLVYICLFFGKNPRFHVLFRTASLRAILCFSEPYECGVGRN